MGFNLNFLRDAFDANTQSDQNKRLARGGQRYYAQDQQAQGKQANRNVLTFLSKNVVEPVINPASKFLNEGVALSQLATGNQAAAKRTLTRGGGLGHQGGVLGGSELDNKAVLLDKRNLEKTIGTGVSIGSNLVAPGAGLTAATLGGKVAKGALFGGALGATGSAGQQIADTGQVTAKNLGIGFLSGAVLGGATPVAGHIIVNRTPLVPTEVGSVGLNDLDAGIQKLAKADSEEQIKQIMKGTPQEIIDKVAPAIAQTRDTNVIRSILTKASPPIREVSHITREDNLPSIVKDGKLNASKPPIPGYEGQKAVYLQDGAKNPYGFPGENNAKIIYKDNTLPTNTVINGDELAVPDGLSASPKDVARIEVSSPNLVPSLEKQGYTVVVNPNLAAKAPDMLPRQQTSQAGQDIVAATVPGKRQRGFLKSAQNAENFSAETKQGIADISPQTYEQKPNDKLFSDTKQIVDKNPTAALQRVYEGADTPAKYDENVAIGGHLIQKLQQEGKIDEAVKIAERLDVQGRDLGRGVQAFAGVTRLNPEGILIYAQKQIRKAREKQSDFTQEKPTAQSLQQQIEGFSPQDGKMVQDTIRSTVKRISEEQQTLPLGGLEPKSGEALRAENTGQKLAKNVEIAATPQVKKKADTLVAELTKKVKQEYLEPKNTAKRAPLDVLKEVFGRTAEAQEAYPLAQQILREKYKNVPTMQKALDKFFGSELSLPAANTTINNAIKDQLSKNGVKISQAIYKSWAAQKQTVEDIAKALTKEGFDKESAQTLAKEVTDRLNKQFAEAKANTLKKLAQEVPEKARQTYIEKLSKLSNIGVLDRSDYIDLARAKLGLPNLSPETAARLSELAQKIQTLPEGTEKYATVREIKQLITENTPLNNKQKALAFLGVPRALLASGDFSFGGRQALAYATTHPIRFAEAWVKQFRYFKEGAQGSDSKAFDNLMGEIQSHKDYEYLRKYGPTITDPFGISPMAREEQFIGSDLAEKIPLAGRLVRGSNYAFTGLANSIRANEFYSQLAHAREAGIELTPKLMEDLGKVIDNSTGRGTVKALEGHMQTLSTTLFAPRLILSRTNTLFNPFYYTKLEPLARKEAIKNLASMSGFIIGALSIAKLGGLNVGTNPTSSDFGKMKVGDTRVDITGGYAQYIKILAQLEQGKTTSSLSGKESDLGSGYGKQSRKDIIAKFLENKANPVVSFATTLAQGSDVVGNPVHTPKEISQQVISRFIPLLYQDLNDVRTHSDSLSPLLAVPLATFGAGVQTYGKQDIKVSDKQNTYIQKLKDKGASKEVIQANKEFFQTLKTAPDRTKATTEVKKALESGDTEKAKQIARDYNQAYASTFKDWADKYGQYGDKTLTKEYNSNKITNDTLQRIQESIKKKGSL